MSTTAHREDTGPAPLTAALRRAAEGLTSVEAGVDLLVAHGCWLERLARAGLVETSDPADMTEPAYAEVRWQDAVTALQAGGLAASGSEGRILQVAPAWPLASRSTSPTPSVDWTAAPSRWCWPR